MALIGTANFKPAEANVSGVVPPSLEDNAQRTLEFLQACRAWLGRPIVITSLYRTQAHNAEIGGAVHSQHMNATGADIDVLGLTNDEALAGIYQGWQQGQIPDFHQLITYTTDHHVHIGIADPAHGYAADNELLREVALNQYEVIDPDTLAQVVADDTSPLNTASQLAGQTIDVITSTVASELAAPGLPTVALAAVLGVLAFMFWPRRHTSRRVVDAR